MEASTTQFSGSEVVRPFQGNKILLILLTLHGLFHLFMFRQYFGWAQHSRYYIPHICMIGILRKYLPFWKWFVCMNCASKYPLVLVLCVSNHQRRLKVLWAYWTYFFTGQMNSNRLCIDHVLQKFCIPEECWSGMQACALYECWSGLSPNQHW